MSGKSTLVRELLRAGADYYSDEFAVLDSEGLVHPFPRRLSLRQEGGLPARRCVAAELGSRTGVEPLPVGTIVFARYRPGARWRPTPLSPGQAVLELLKSTFCALQQPELALNALDRVVVQARSWKGFRGEAAEAAAALLADSTRRVAVLQEASLVGALRSFPEPILEDAGCPSPSLVPIS